MKKVLKSGDQGDVVFIKIKKLPKGSKKQKEKVLVASTNPHTAESGTVYKLGEDTFLKCETPTKIIHNQHEPLCLSEGIWFVGKKREKGLFSGLVAPVVD